MPHLLYSEAVEDGRSDDGRKKDFSETKGKYLIILKCFYSSIYLIIQTR